MHRIIPRSEWGARHGTGWGTRPLPATEAYVHYPGAKAPPGPAATFEEDAAYVRYLEDIGYQRFRDADYVNGVDQWPGEPGAGISYSLVITRAGRIFRGHDPARQSSHTKGHNATGMGHCYLTDGTQALTDAQIDAGAWALGEQVRLGELAQARYDGGHRDVFPTICPTDPVYAQIPTLNARARGGTVSKRYPTSTDLRSLEKRAIARGFVVTCGPASHYDRGYCAPGKHPHMDGSAHFRGMALDLSWPGPAISDIEALHMELLAEELARDPAIAWRVIWNHATGDHDDHLHVDDLKRQGWGDSVKPRTGVRARDGIDLFVSRQAFPDHVPPTNDGYSLTWVYGFQREAQKRSFFTGVADGYLGPVTRRAAEAVQTAYGLDVDGVPGPATMAALDSGDPLQPEPTPTPRPEPVTPPAATLPAGSRIAGTDRYATSAAAYRAAPATLQRTVYLAAGNAPTLADALSAPPDGCVLLVRAGQATLPSPVAAALANLRPTSVRALGSADLVTDAALTAARAAAGITT